MFSHPFFLFSLVMVVFNKKLRDIATKHFFLLLFMLCNLKVLVINCYELKSVIIKRKQKP